MGIFDDIVGFQWDDGNRDKNLTKHGVSGSECEEAFDDTKKVVRTDTQHSHTEARQYVIGKTKSGRILFVSFTIRRNLIRVISARDINKKERYYYE